jgi:hypothetical protein
MASAPQFIVSADPPLLQQIISGMRADADVQVVNVSGPPASPHRVVAQMADTKAEELRQRFGGRVTVEPNQPLEPS